MSEFLKSICPCLFGNLEDEVPLIDDIRADAQDQSALAVNQRNDNENETSRAGRPGRSRHNNYRQGKYRFHRDEETERELKALYDRTKERMININEMHEDVDFEKLRKLFDNDSYMKEIELHDKMSTDVIEKDCLLDPTGSEEEQMNLLTNACPLPAEQSQNINNILNKLKDSLDKMNNIEFDEPLVVYMDL
uniref:Reverse transcriptase domain-containing protein n=1 Tax=Parastrongyloides trichosuri TaxID=131310 RepID=A0A0N4ZC25_PARTI